MTKYFFIFPVRLFFAYIVLKLGYTSTLSIMHTRNLYTFVFLGGVRVMVIIFPGTSVSSIIPEIESDGGCNFEGFVVVANLNYAIHYIH